MPAQNEVATGSRKPRISGPIDSCTICAERRVTCHPIAPRVCALLNITVRDGERNPGGACADCFARGWSQWCYTPPDNTPSADRHPPQEWKECYLRQQEEKKAWVKRRLEAPRLKGDASENTLAPKTRCKPPAGVPRQSREPSRAGEPAQQGFSKSGHIDSSHVSPSYHLFPRPLPKEDVDQGPKHPIPAKRPLALTDDAVLNLSEELIGKQGEWEVLLGFESEIINYGSKRVVISGWFAKRILIGGLEVQLYLCVDLKQTREMQTEEMLLAGQYDPSANIVWGIILPPPPCLGEAFHGRRGTFGLQGKFDIRKSDNYPSPGWLSRIRYIEKPTAAVMSAGVVICTPSYSTTVLRDEGAVAEGTCRFPTGYLAFINQQWKPDMVLSDILATIAYTHLFVPWEHASAVPPPVTRGESANDPKHKAYPLSSDRFLCLGRYWDLHPDYARILRKPGMARCRFSISVRILR